MVAARNNVMFSWLGLSRRVAVARMAGVVVVVRQGRCA